MISILSISERYFHLRQYYLNKLDIWVPHKLNEIQLETRKDVIFHQDNARPHTSLVTGKKLLELGWEVMPNPPYSLDLAPSDYH